MMVYVGQTRSAKLVRQLWKLGIGECTARGELPPRRHPYFYDNGAFKDWSAGVPFDESQFCSDVADITGSSTHGDVGMIPRIPNNGFCRWCGITWERHPFDADPGHAFATPNAPLSLRVFVPSSEYVLGTGIRTSVHRWIWTRRSGLRVEYVDGLTCRSDYSLPELLSTERPIEARYV